MLSKMLTAQEGNSKNYFPKWSWDYNTFAETKGRRK